ncbi:MAG: VOC family protein [Gracilimonas sp.]|nr:VOC family protein [Gracilimonas sp.]
MFSPKFDHYTIKVEDLNVSSTFYSNVLGVEEIKNRTEKPHIRWFSLGSGELYLVEGDRSEIQTDIGVHLALKIRDFDDFLSLLQKHGITPHSSSGKTHDYTTRADGVKQVYFKDPDGYWIEVNNAK